VGLVLRGQQLLQLLMWRQQTAMSLLLLQGLSRVLAARPQQQLGVLTRRQQQQLVLLLVLVLCWTQQRAFLASACATQSMR
jgi:hypothetical protein